MRNRIKEGTVLFIGVLKWFVLATAVGSIVGLSTALFLKLLNWSTLQTGRFEYYYFALVLIFPLSALIIKYLAPAAEGHGTEKVIEAVHKNSGMINLAVVPVKLLTTVITLAFGGSAGKEGPAAQIGAGLASFFARLIRLDKNDHKKLVICGISAGFAAIFGTPIAGAIFGVEVLFVGSLLYDVLLPSFIAGITSYQVAHAFGIEYFYHPLTFVPVFKESFFVEVVLAGVFFGIASFIFIEIIQFGKKLSEKIKAGNILKGIAAGAVLVGLTLVFSRQYLGLGLDTIEAALEGQALPWYSAILKSVYTTITLNFGGSGGIITPIFYVGTAAGNLFARIAHADPATFAAMGMVGLLAGTTNTPIAASIMAMELFGPKIAPYAAVICVISFLMTGHRSVYPSQVLSIRKSPHLEAEIGREMEDTSTELKLKDKSVAGRIIGFVRKMKEYIKKYSD
ncbi:MAG: chloride channel protein [Elusimicrobiota bacterium]